MQNVQRRINRCSFCRREGHNRLTCDDPRLLEFALTCATQCQTMTETEFYVWLTETYETNDLDLLKTYAAKKMRIPFNNIRDISIYKDAITRYIYETYKYQYNIQEEDSDYYLENNMNAALINDIRSAYLFLEMTENMHARRIEQTKKFAIISLLKTLSTKEKKETEECCICFESYKKPEFVTLNCNHEFCKECVKKSLISDNRPKPCCAYCRTEVTTMTSRISRIHNDMSKLVI